MRATRIIGLLLILVLVACSGGGAVRPAGSGAPAPASAMEGSVSTGAQPDPGSVPSAAASCGPTAIRISTGTPPAPICVTAGAEFQVTSDPSPQQPWSTLESSDPAILICQSRAYPDGSVYAACHAVKPGTVTLTSTTAPFSGDPHGPQLHRWQITVSVEP